MINISAKHRKVKVFFAKQILKNNFFIEHLWWLLLTEQWQKAKLFLFVEPSTNGVWIQHSILCSTHSLHCSHSTENLVPSSFFIFGHQWRHCCIGIFYPGVCYLMFILLILRINSFVVNLENYFLRLICRNV